MFKIPNPYACAVLLIKWLEFSLKCENNNFPQKIIISWKISKFLKSDWKQHRNSLRPFLVVFQTTFEKSWKIILKNHFFDKMKKNTFFSIISTRQRMHTYLGSNFQDSLSMSEIIGSGPVNAQVPILQGYLQVGLGSTQTNYHGKRIRRSE